MIIRFYKNSASSNQVDKTNFIQEYRVLDGNLREGTSITNPIIIVELPEGELFSGNYCYIEDFKRYYFINEISSYRNKLWTINMSVDVLMSYKDTIRLQQGFVSRQENVYNDELVDKMIPYEYKSSLEILNDYPFIFNKHYGNFSSKFIKGYHYALDIITTSKMYCFNVDTGDVRYNDIFKVKQQNPSLETAIAQTIFCKDLDFLEMVVEFETTVGSFIKNIVYSPIPFIGYDSTTNNYYDANQDIINNKLIIDSTLTNEDWNNYMGLLGNLEIPDEWLGTKIFPPLPLLVIGRGPRAVKFGSATAKLYNYCSCPTNFIPCKKQYITITRKYNNFMDYSPYTEIYIYLPFYGTYKLDMENRYDNKIGIYYCVNQHTGDGVIILYDTVRGDFIDKLDCQIGTEISYDTANYEQQRIISANNKQALGVGIATSALSIGLGIATGGIGASLLASAGPAFALAAIKTKTEIPLNAGRGAIPIINDISNYISSERSNIAMGKNTSNIGDYIPYTYGTNIMVFRKYNKMLLPYNYNKLIGKPLEDVKILSRLSGFTIVSGIRLEGFDEATSEEIDMIYNLLNTGIIL